MIYNERCVVVTHGVKEGYLGDELGNPVETIVPCGSSDLSLDEQEAVFGVVNREAVKIHLLGLWVIDSVIYHGVPRTPVSYNYHRNSTVVIVQ
jgi:hypothetical protein